MTNPAPTLTDLADITVSYAEDPREYQRQYRRLNPRADYPSRQEDRRPTACSCGTTLQKRSLRQHLRGPSHRRKLLQKCFKNPAFQEALSHGNPRAHEAFFQAIAKGDWSPYHNRVMKLK